MVSSLDPRRELRALQSSENLVMADVTRESLLLMRSCSPSRARYFACNLLKEACRAGEGGEAVGEEKTQRREEEGEEKEEEGEEEPEDGEAIQEEEVEVVEGRAAGEPVCMGTAGREE